MYFTYILLSQRNGDLYVGSTENVENRFRMHNSGRVRSTKANRPWKLLETKSFETRSETMIHEKFLKNHQQKEILKAKYGLVAKW